jgi:hypothetical protein
MRQQPPRSSRRSVLHMNYTREDGVSRTHQEHQGGDSRPGRWSYRLGKADAPIRGPGPSIVPQDGLLAMCCGSVILRGSVHRRGARAGGSVVLVIERGRAARVAHDLECRAWFGWMPSDVIYPVPLDLEDSASGPLTRTIRRNTDRVARKNPGTFFDG